MVWLPGAPSTKLSAQELRALASLSSLAGSILHSVSAHSIHTWALNDRRPALFSIPLPSLYPYRRSLLDRRLLPHDIIVNLSLLDRQSMSQPLSTLEPFSCKVVSLPLFSLCFFSYYILSVVGREYTLSIHPTKNPPCRLCLHLSPLPLLTGYGPSLTLLTTHTYLPLLSCSYPVDFQRPYLLSIINQTLPTRPYPVQIKIL